jgi:hypothetical protein
LVLSFLLVPKGFSWLYVHGSLLVLGACMVVSIFKKLEKVPFRRSPKDYSLNYRDDTENSDSSTPSDVDRQSIDNSGITHRGEAFQVV